MKKAINEKSVVRIRTKAMKGGLQSLYLDIYSEGVRKYQFLKLYLVPETTTKAKMENRSTMRLAELKKAEVLMQIKENYIAGRKLLSNTIENMTLPEFYEKYINYSLKQSTIKVRNLLLNAIMRELPHLKTIKDLTEENQIGMIEYIKSHRMSECSYNARVSMINNIIDTARDLGVRMEKSSLLKVIKHKNKIKDYLTLEELRYFLSQSHKADELAGKPFLFSCLTGLRYSDIKQLTWGMVKKGNSGENRLVFTATKTGIDQNLPIPDMALELAGKRGKPDEYLFPKFAKEKTHRIIYRLNQYLKKVNNTGKHLTFHSARHTYAVSMITLGTDIFTVSKLLGHNSVKSTEVYAKIVDSKFTEAVSSLQGFYK